MVPALAFHTLVGLDRGPGYVDPVSLKLGGLEQHRWISHRHAIVQTAAVRTRCKALDGLHVLAQRNTQPALTLAGSERKVERTIAIVDTVVRGVVFSRHTAIHAAVTFTAACPKRQSPT